MVGKRAKRINQTDDQAPAPAQAIPPVTSGPKVNLSVFLAVSTVKPDQMAGFCYWAKKNRLGPMTIRDWKQEYTNFMGRPIN
jgi:hypothetical protein